MFEILAEPLSSLYLRPCPAVRDYSRQTMSSQMSVESGNSED